MAITAANSLTTPGLVDFNNPATVIVALVGLAITIFFYREKYQGWCYLSILVTWLAILVGLDLICQLLTLGRITLALLLSELGQIFGVALGARRSGCPLSRFGSASGMYGRCNFLPLTDIFDTIGTLIGIVRKGRDYCGNFWKTMNQKVWIRLFILRTSSGLSIGAILWNL